MAFRTASGYAGSVASDDAVGSIPWVDAPNAEGAPDGSGATADGAGLTEWLLANGYSLLIPGTAHPLLARFIRRARAYKVQVDVFTTNGTHPYEVPDGATAVRVQLWGSGGSSPSTSTPSRGGGGGGAYAESTLTTLTPLASYNVVISSSNPDSQANATTLDTNVVVAAAGQVGQTSAGGQGGQAASSVGDIVYSGGDGGARDGTSGGGGGAAAGPSGPGANGADGAGGSGGNGGSGSASGGGDGGDGGNTGQNGVAGSAPGGGAGGRGRNGSGAAGGLGQAILTAFIPVDAEVEDDAVRLVIDGIVQDTELAKPGFWSGTYADLTYGPIDLSAMTPAEVATLGIAFSTNVGADSRADVDSVKMEVDYEIFADVTLTDPAGPDREIDWPNYTLGISVEVDGTPVTIDRSRWRIYADAEGTQLVYDSGLLTGPGTTHTIGSGTPALAWRRPRDGETYYVRVEVREDGGYDGGVIDGVSAFVSITINAGLGAVSNVAVEAITEGGS